MILIYKSGKVTKLDFNFDFPRFRLPVQLPMTVQWVEEDEVVTICPPDFAYLEFEYVATVDDEPIYKEMKNDKV